MDNTSVWAIVLNPSNTKVLLIHRLKDSKEFWVFPGGPVEEGESLGDAIAREVKDGTNLKINKIFENRENDFMVEVDDAKPAMNGSEVQTDNDWFNPEWVVINTALKLENLSPASIMEWFKEKYNK